MTENGAVFPMFYLPPVQYFSLIYQHRHNILIEKDEHLVKQTYRNRAHIYSPDGLLSLVVPVIKGSKVHTQMKDVRISYDFNWQRLHWMSLQGCYRRSAYFEYYEADFARFYEEKFDFLFDYNEQLLKMIIGMTKLKANISLTETYERNYPDMADYRMAFSAKKEMEYEQNLTFRSLKKEKGL